MLPQLQFKASILYFDIKPATGKRVFNRRSKCLIRPNLKNRLKRSSKIAPIWMKYRSKSTNLSYPGRRLSVGSEMVIKAPASKRLVNSQHLRRSLGIGDTGQHAVGVGEVLRQHHRLFVSHRR